MHVPPFLQGLLTAHSFMSKECKKWKSKKYIYSSSPLKLRGLGLTISLTKIAAPHRQGGNPFGFSRLTRTLTQQSVLIAVVL